MTIKRFSIGNGKAELIGWIHPDYSLERASAIKERPSLIICPGGGYAFHSVIEEDEALSALYAAGYNVFSLHYSVGEEIRKSEPEKELAIAVSLLKTKAEELGLGHKVAVMGFSAGGHLVASFCCHLKDYDSVCSPDAAVLVYPVITMGYWGHEGSRDLLCHGDKERELHFSLEGQIYSGFPPVFIFHTEEDELVNVRNSLMFYMELVEKGIPSEYHVFEKGLHGMALGDVASGMHYECANAWFGLLLRWLSEKLDFKS